MQLRKFGVEDAVLISIAGKLINLQQLWLEDNRIINRGLEVLALYLQSLLLFTFCQC